MNAYMNITVRVHGQAAQAQIKALQAQIRAMDAQLAKANATASNPAGIASARSRKSLMAWGNQLQWTGRQIQYNWTLPIAVAGAAAVKFALDNERAMTRVVKVYGDADSATQWYTKHQGALNDMMQKYPNVTDAASAASQSFKNELDALGDSFEVLSSKYGIAQSEVIETAGAWAAAGSSGVALAKSVDLSMQAAVLGEMDLAKATEALISIQAQYSLGADDLALALAELNAIENQTAISMQGLIEGFGRSAGVAREYGVDVRHLGAMLAALVPATGSAATAGNALKTIMSRLMAPTEAARKVMLQFGVDTADSAWQSSTAMERLQIISDKLNNNNKANLATSKGVSKAGYEISDSQRAVAASYLGSNYQVNRFLVLMRELAPAHSNYEKALEATANDTKVFQQAQKELAAVLESNPKRLEILWYTLQNGMADVIQPMIPYLLYMVDTLRRMMQAFQNLDPAAQKFILWTLVALAAVGPLVKYMGSFVTLLGVLYKPLQIAGAGLGLLAGGFRRSKDGADESNRSWLRMIATMLAAPFAFMARGLGTLARSTVTFSQLMFGATTAVTTFNSLSAKAASKNPMPKIYRNMWSGITGIFVAGGAAAAGATAATNSALVGITAAGEAARAAEYAAGGVARVRAESTTNAKLAAVDMAMYKWVLDQARANFAAKRGLESAAKSTSLALHGTYLTTYTGMDEAFYAYLLNLYRAFLMAQMQLQRGASAGMIALNSGTQWTVTAETVAAQRVALGSTAATTAAQVGFFAKMRTRILGILASMLAPVKLLSRGLFVALANPYVLAGVAIIGALYLLRKQVVQVWNNVVEYFSDTNNGLVRGIIKAWNALPAGVSNALVAVANIVRDAALQIYEWFSYINPFARHSPSLVENVENGMARIIGEFSKFDKIKGHIKGAYAEIKAFGKATAGLIKSQEQLQRSEDRKQIKKYAPGALDEFKALTARLKQLRDDLKSIQPVMDKQQAVVDKWQKKLDAVNNALDNQQYLLDQLSARQQAYQDLVDEATDRLDHFASVGITGQRAMSDAIFENEMAQKRLRLEMMRIEDVTGPLDDVRAKIEAINGAQEMLRGTQAELRSAGAGSEILQHYQDEIDLLEQQKQAYTDAAAPLNDLQKQLDALQRKGEELDLVNSLEFDPLTRQIEQAANAMEELPFDQIMAGIQGAKTDIDNYKVGLDAATAAVEAQQKVVDSLSASRDALQIRLTNEQYQLDQIKNAYDEVADAISSVEDALNLATQAASALSTEAAKGAKDKAAKVKSLSPAERNFADAAGGNFADIAGDGMPFRDDWKDQTEEIKKLTEQWSKDASGAFANLNPFGGFKKKWNEFKDWFKGAVGEVGDFFSQAFSGVSGGGAGSDLIAKFKEMGPAIKDAWSSVQNFLELLGKWAGKIWDLFGPTITDAIQSIGDAFGKAWDKIGPELKGLWDEITKLGPAFQGFKNVVVVLVGFAMAKLLPVLSVIANVFGNAIGPAIEMVGGIIGNLIQIAKGMLQVVSGFFMLFTGDFKGAFKKMGAGILNIVSGLLGGIGDLLWGAVKTLAGAAWGIVEGIWKWMVWLWDVLFGHSIIPDIVDAFFEWFGKLVDLVQWTWNNVVMPVVNIFKKLFDLVIGALKLWWGGITLAWAVLKTIAVWLWDNVLKPVWDAVVSVWTNFVQPAFAAWWAGIQVAWNGLLTAAQWLWDNVLKPIWDAVVAVWNNFVQPAFAAWWAGVQASWDTLKAAAGWLWDNVLKPVFDKVKDLWDTKVKPSFTYWWEGVKVAWNALKQIGTWIWDNVLNPVWTQAKNLWNNVKLSLEGWWEGIKTAWNALTGVGKWIKDNVMDPVFDKITGGWNRVKTWLEDNKDLLTKPVSALVNTVISAVNTIINGLNTVGKVLPGVEWHIDPIPKLAAGGSVPGRSANRGFVTSGARAIVGEGKANYPEFVIPTDPTYRNRARSLLEAAASRINGGTRAGAGNGTRNSFELSEHGVPMFKKGGWLGDKLKVVKQVGEKIKDLAKNAVGKVMDPVLDGAHAVVKSAKPDWTPAKIPPYLAIEKIRGWVKDTDAQVKKAKKKYAPTPVGGSVGVPDPSNPAGRAAWKGGTFTNRFIAHMKKAEELAGASISVTQGGFRPATSYSGTSHQGDAIDLQVNNNLIRALRQVGIAAGDRTGLGNWAPHVHAIPGPSAGYAAGSATWQWQDYMAKGGASQPFNSTWGLKEGGIALARRGPVRALIGDGRYDEAVVPLPKGWRSMAGNQGGGEKHYHFHGDLVFPNVKNGDDAKTFLDNLESLAED